MALRALGRYARPDRLQPVEGEHCELCNAPIGSTHSHVVDLERRTLCCTCRPCALLFVDIRARNAKYRTVPDRVLVDPAFTLQEDEWGALEIPVRLSFVFYNSSLSRWVAVYPSPAGPTESEIKVDAWETLSKRTRMIEQIEPDVEAFVVRGRRGEASFDCFVAPIDACYELVASVRRHWKGFDGGDGAREAIDSFFESLRSRSKAIAKTVGRVG